MAAGPYADFELDVYFGCPMEYRCLSRLMLKKDVEIGVQATGYCRKCEVYLSIQFERQRANRRMREAAERAVKVRWCAIPSRLPVADC